MSPRAGASVQETRDLDEAREIVTAAFAPHRLVARDARSLDFRLQRAGAGELTVGRLRYGAETEVAAPPRAAYHVNLAVHGTATLEQGGRAGAARAGRSAAVLDPDEPATLRWSPDADHYVVKVPRAVLQAQLAALLGRPVDEPVHLDLEVALTTPRGQSLAAAVEHLCGELFRDGGGAPVPLARAQLESYVLTQLLLVVPHDHHDELVGSTTSARRRHVEDALDFIHAHAAQPIGGADIARAACVSLRALQAGFHDEVGVAPTAYLRDVRLTRVHAELSAGAASVSEVASRWGFAHLGRFAEQYRRKYGVRPSATIQGRDPG